MMKRILFDVKIKININRQYRVEELDDLVVSALGVRLQSQATFSKVIG
jgi:hypothetical protein